MLIWLGGSCLRTKKAALCQVYSCPKGGAVLAFMVIRPCRELIPLVILWNRIRNQAIREFPAPSGGGEDRQKR